MHLKVWRFSSKTKRMSAEQRQLFEETLAADQADLGAQLVALKVATKEPGDTPDTTPHRQPKRQALHEHLKRVEHPHEPENTRCRCGQAMVRIDAAIWARVPGQLERVYPDRRSARRA
jgi:hypothetical protein